MIKLGLSVCARIVASTVPVIKQQTSSIQRHYSTNFYNKLTAEQLWKGVTSVSNAGRKRGRAKGISKKGMKNLNRGQVIGVGKANMFWPGLTGPVIRGREVVQQQQLPPDPEREARLIKMRDEFTGRRSRRLHPLDRGWSGAKMGGRSIGPPDPIGEDTFEGFDSKVLEYKMVTVMTGNLGRKRRMSVMAITGNGAGLAGFAMGKAIDPKTALRVAKNRAGQKLIYFDLYNNHTVFHDFFCQFGKTKIFAKKMPEGYGLVCHRAIRTCCQVIGIKDLYAKVEGPTNLQHIVKAFFIGLLQQKSHEQLAEEKQLHVVEIREERDNFPVVVASPTKCRTDAEVPVDENRDFTQYVQGGRVVLQKKKWPRFYQVLPGWEKHLKKTLYRRNHPDVRVRLFAEYGELRSFLADTYPECRAVKGPIKAKK